MSGALGERLQVGVHSAPVVELLLHVGVLGAQLRDFALESFALQLELLFLRETLLATVGSVAAVLQRSPSLLQHSDVIRSQSLEQTVEFANAERY